MIQFFNALLGKVPVLAMFASEIATGACDAEPEMPGNEMVERSFFNGTCINNRWPAIGQSV
jgi:hypothetical protein